MNIKKCTYCGKEYPDEATFCSIDGTLLEPITPQQPNKTYTLNPPYSTQKKQIINISIHQTCKVLAILYIAIGLIFIPIGVISILAGNTIIGIIYVLMPFIYGIITYPITAAICWVYNMIAKSIGGIEFTLEDKNHKT